MQKEFQIGNLIRIVNPNPNETIYYEENTIMEVVGKTFLPMAYDYKEVEYTLRNTEENTILKKSYKYNQLEELPKCTACGNYIEGYTYQDTEENTVCEDCFIAMQAKRMGLVKE